MKDINLRRIGSYLLIVGSLLSSSLIIRPLDEIIEKGNFIRDEIRPRISEYDGRKGISKKDIINFEKINGVEIKKYRDCLNWLVPPVIKPTSEGDLNYWLIHQNMDTLKNLQYE